MLNKKMNQQLQVYFAANILLWVSILSFQYKKFNLNIINLLLKIHTFFIFLKARDPVECISK